jgi:hypothetical protein
MTYDELRTYLLKHYPESKLQLLPEERRVALVAKHPMLPGSYVQFLCEVGFGTIGDSLYSVYGGAMDPSDVIDRSTAEDLHDVVLIGDDFAGGQEAFHLQPPSAVFGSIDINGHFEPDTENPTFSDFIKGWFVV